MVTITFPQFRREDGFIGEILHHHKSYLKIHNLVYLLGDLSRKPLLYILLNKQLVLTSVSHHHKRETTGMQSDSLHLIYNKEKPNYASEWSIQNKLMEQMSSPCSIVQCSKKGEDMDKTLLQPCRCKQNCQSQQKNERATK